MKPSKAVTFIIFLEGWNVFSFSFPPSGRGREKKGVAVPSFQEDLMNISMIKGGGGGQPQFICCYQQLKILYLIAMEAGTIQQSGL